MDDDDDLDELDIPQAMKPMTTWRQPALLPGRPDVAAANLVSTEVSVQNERMKNVVAEHYSSEFEVPSSPAPLSDVEQALDMTAQSSAVLASMPFFVPDQPVPVPVPVAASIPFYDPAPVIPSFPPSHGSGATPEFVQSLGLPMFLVGQDVQALQTLSRSPGLLATLVDGTGAYDQGRLMGLVQTLSVTNGSHAQPPSAFPPSNGGYGGSSPAPAYGQAPPFQNGPPRSGFRANSDGNLHISGYGPTTTQADIIGLFAPYVHVDEVVMKGTFSFVNTSDPVNAQRAREALTGTLLCGMPVRINPAQRKARDSNAAYQPSSGGAGAPFSGAPPYAGANNPGSTGGMGTPYGGAPPVPGPGSLTQGGMLPPQGGMLPPQGGMNPPPQNVDTVRDDRGNPSTKNLFVAGYGQGTTEQDVRDLFGQHANVIGVVSKGSFTFVNTSERSMAVRCRQMLGGTMVNGGVLRINFAKETGRLGTSFDLTYGPNTGPNAGPGQEGGPSARPGQDRPPNSRNSAPPNNGSYYGRGY
jgi:RNA recognition motif-containing protein